MCETRVHDIDELRRHLLHVWHSLEQSLIDDTVVQRLTRLFVPVADILNMPCDYQFVFSVGVLDEFYASHHT